MQKLERPSISNTTRAADWRAVGRNKPKTRNVDDNDYGPVFVVAMGYGKLQCLLALRDILENMPHPQIEKLDSIWLEEWRYPTPFNPGRWVPWKEARIKKYKLRAATIATNASGQKRRKCKSHLLESE